MARHNHPKHPRNNHSPNPADRYDVDYAFLPDAPEIAAVVVPTMKTIYRNMCCASWADAVHEAKGEKDKYLAMIQKVY